MTARIRNTAELRALNQGKYIRQLRLEFPQLQPVENDDWTSQLNRTLSACGCQEGTAGISLFLALGLVDMHFHLHQWPSGRWAEAGFLLLAVVTGGAIGKAIGTIRARRKFRLLLKKLASIVTQRTDGL